MIRGKSRTLGRVTSIGLVLAAGLVLLPASVAAQRCALDVALGAAIPAGRAPNGTEPDASLSAGWSMDLGLECGPPSIRFGVDIEWYRLGAQDFVFGNAIGITGFLARLGREFRQRGDSRGPWVTVAAQAGVIQTARIPGSYVAILHSGRQLDFDWDIAVGGNLRLGWPVSSRWSVLLDLAVRANSLSTFDPQPAERPGMRTLVAIPVRVGARLAL